MTKIKTKKQKAEKENFNLKIINIVQKQLNLMMLQKKTKEDNPSQLKIPDHLYVIIIIGGSRLGKQMHYLI